MANIQKQLTSSTDMFHLAGSWADIMADESSPLRFGNVDDESTACQQDFDDADESTDLSLGQATPSISSPEFSPSTPPTSEDPGADCLTTLLEWGCKSPCQEQENQMLAMQLYVPCAVMPLAQPWAGCQEHGDSCDAQAHSEPAEMPQSQAICPLEFYPVQQFLVPVIIPINSEQTPSIAMDETSWQYGEDAMMQGQAAAWSLEAGPWDPFEAAVFSSLEDPATGAAAYVEEGVWLDYVLNEMQDPNSWYNGGGTWGAFAEAHGESNASRRRRQKKEAALTSVDASAAGQSQMGHCKVPRNIDLKGQYGGDGPEAEPITTLMIRNVPNRYSQEMLVAELEELGFRNLFDFVYLPIDRITRWNVGYAFVNFLNAETARSCTEKLQGYTFTRYKQRFGKSAIVSNAHMQGLHKNVEHYRFSAVQCDQIEGRRPRFYDAPWCAEFGARPLNEMDWPLPGVA